MDRSSSHRSHKRKRSENDDESAESRFSIQPKDAQKIKEDRYREKDREREKQKEREHRDGKRIREDSKSQKEGSSRRDTSSSRDERNKKQESSSRRDDHRHREDRRDRDRRDNGKNDRNRKRRSRSRSSDRTSSRKDDAMFGKSKTSSSHKASTSDGKKERSITRSPDSRRSNYSSRASNTPQNSKARDKKMGERDDRSRTKSPVRSTDSSKRSTDIPENAALFDRILDPNYKKKDTRVLEIEDVEMSPVELKDEEEVSTFTFEDTCGPARPTTTAAEPEESDHKSEDAPESPSNSLTPTPDLSGYQEVEPLNDTLSSVEDEDESEKYAVTPDPDAWETMSDAEQEMHKRAMENRRTKRHKDAVARLPVYYPGLHGCQHIHEYAILHVIAEGTFGEVFRGKDKRTDEIVALKRFKMEREREGFPITALREINMLLKAGNHPNIVNVKEILVGNTKTEVYMAMEFLDHDVKTLLDDMKKRNRRLNTGQQKNLMLQLFAGLEHMHKLWIIHRDLKTSNLLLSDSGVLKIADFGLAREYGYTADPDKYKKMTPLVVTLWYRSPELLLGAKKYGTPVDMWSIGCIMAEFVLMDGFLKGKNEPQQVDLIFSMMGTPTEATWPDVINTEIWKIAEFNTYSPGKLKQVFRQNKMLSDAGYNLLNGLLSVNPDNRLAASEALDHRWFDEHPLPASNKEIPKLADNSEPIVTPQMARKNRLEALLAEEDPDRAQLLRDFNVRAEQVKPSGFQLKF